jgi:DNA-binding CsgD family transcriptional regulator
VNNQLCGKNEKEGTNVYSRRLKALECKRVLVGHFVSKARGGQKFHTSQGALSVREAEIFQRFGEGKRTSEIARELMLSLKTGQAYCGRIKEKRGFASLHELQIAAVRQATSATSRSPNV